VPSPQAPDDRVLIARALATSDAASRVAFGELVRRHQSSVRATLRRLTNGNDALADDLAQEAFVLAWRNLASFRDEARFSTWLYRIATNCWLANARKRKDVLLGDRGEDVEHDDDDEDAMSALGASVGDSSHATSLRMDMARAMRVLSDGERAAIVQCYDNDLTHEEAAYVLGIPVGTVKTHILRAKKKLKAAMADWAS
jgi:RNA polymerase sigma-70 factor (ECF subfamily)